MSKSRNAFPPARGGFYSYYFTPLREVDPRYARVAADLTEAIEAIVTVAHERCAGTEACTCPALRQDLTQVLRRAYDPRAEFDPSRHPRYLAILRWCTAVLGEDFARTHLTDQAARAQFFATTLEREAIALHRSAARLQHDEVVDAVTKTVVSPAFTTPVHDQPVAWPWLKPGILRNTSKHRLIDAVRSHDRHGVTEIGATRITLEALTRLSPDGEEYDITPPAADDTWRVTLYLCAAGLLGDEPSSAPRGAKAAKAALMHTVARSVVCSAAADPAVSSQIEAGALRWVVWEHLRLAAPDTWGRYPLDALTIQRVEGKVELETEVNTSVVRQIAQAYPEDAFFSKFDARKRNLGCDLLSPIVEMIKDAIWQAARG